MTQNYRRQVWITALSWCFWELLCVGQVKAIEHRYVFLSTVLSLVLPLVGFVSSVWWVEQETWRGRLGLTAAGAVGAALGTLTVMTFWN